MNTDVKALQQLSEISGGAAVLDWSTISHTHGGPKAVDPGMATASVDFGAVANLVSQLQQLPQAKDATPAEWSTISHTHKT